MHVTFSTIPLKCCHFTLQNVKRDKMTNWLYIIHYSTLKINHTVKFVELFEKMFRWAPLFLITVWWCCFHWSMLLLIKVYRRHQFKTVEWVERTLSDFHQQHHWRMETTSWVCYQEQRSSHWTSFQIIWPILLFD